MRLCNQRVVIDKEDIGPCVEQTVDPRSPYCYWHRLVRTDHDGQRRAALLRLAAAPMPHRNRVPPLEWPPGKRWCSGCQSFVPLFYVTGTKCLACARMAQAARRRETVYGISDEDWDRIMEIQGGLCAVCRRKQRDRAPAVEHNHGTGRVRGGACVNCNRKVLGGAFDSPWILMSAVIYLLRPPSSGSWVPPERCVDDLLRMVKAALEVLADETTVETTGVASGRTVGAGGQDGRKPGSVDVDREPDVEEVHSARS